MQLMLFLLSLTPNTDRPKPSLKVCLNDDGIQDSSTQSSPPPKKNILKLYFALRDTKTVKVIQNYFIRSVNTKLRIQIIIFRPVPKHFIPCQ